MARPLEFSEPSSDRAEFDLAVIGLGYVGLPVSVAFSRAGLRVLAYDVDKERIDLALEGSSYIEDVSSHELTEALDNGFTPTVNPMHLAKADAVIVCVPTPLTERQPDLEPIRSAVADVAINLRPGMLVVLESTTFPGTTEEVALPLLEAGSGLIAGVDFHLAYSPERLDPGNTVWQLANTPKIVGGIDEVSSQRAADLYRNICDEVLMVGGTREAEMAKLLENTYRHVNIALVNEFAILCHNLGIDPWEVIEAASTKPFGFEPFYPGPGVGGHCIPIDPSYLAYRARQHGFISRLIETAQDINAAMPEYVVSRAIGILNRAGIPTRGARILLVGVAYKANVSDTRLAPALDVAEQLESLGADVEFSDPHVDELFTAAGNIRRRSDIYHAAAEADVTILLTPHDAIDFDALAARARLVLDTRGVMFGPGVERL